MTIRHACAILGAAVSATALALAPVLPAHGAVSNGWRVVFTDHYGAAANQASYQTVIALIPGTTSLLGASDAARTAGGWNAVVWAYGTFG